MATALVASKRPKDRDVNRNAFLTVMRATESLPEPKPKPDTRNLAAVLGKLGAAKGGEARAAKLSARKRREIAKKAARARWGRRLGAQ